MRSFSPADWRPFGGLPPLTKSYFYTSSRRGTVHPSLCRITYLGTYHQISSAAGYPFQTDLRLLAMRTVRGQHAVAAAAAAREGRAKVGAWFPFYLFFLLHMYNYVVN
ncbi:hypothetical protein BO83DRAFT_212987 [Aspergillus eucalypticola CBS 122712]|uniref:Uncharacterized protein n=1 Tax=Aspergillus eucalypticola (strain CBS 122712 / IBT 29274) TaxID=1448314 RepID=A0A317VWK1_ASPEC|nr:uncharacterized protein BO83DRAFT_212987 [Aspergillus eucalypticola CBS 122712]PWY78673.1 hypothetical protein BO83DRAFT_212987 [Aspergillus eucalypticola CBS 122712]